ncbi:hypothetical protein V8G54_024199 [Vigna mungo]|uniref:SUI1 domain-containing protein n=1 Tax=Vigna mungo TaxID=3915 RepID=A0AAQ3RSB5_VIGMU
MICPRFIDPFAEANADDSGAGSKEYVHIRVQQRNGRKSLTTVQGLKKEFSYNKILGFHDSETNNRRCILRLITQIHHIYSVSQRRDQIREIAEKLREYGKIREYSIYGWFHNHGNRVKRCLPQNVSDISESSYYLLLSFMYDPLWVIP